VVTLSQIAPVPRRQPIDWIQRFYVGVAPWREHRDVRVSVTTTQDAVEEIVLAKVFAALDILYDTIPAQLERIPRMMHGLTIAKLRDAIGVWRSDLGVCLLDETYVVNVDTTPQDVASTIVHELTHARLERAGFRYNVMARARCERVCFLAERNFVLLLPPSEERERLAMRNAGYLAMSPDYWSAEQVEARRAARPLWERAAYRIMQIIIRLHRRAT
jgi:hypothetical protein